MSSIILPLIAIAVILVLAECAIWCRGKENKTKEPPPPEDYDNDNSHLNNQHFDPH